MKFIIQSRCLQQQVSPGSKKKKKPSVSCVPWLTKEWIKCNLCHKGILIRHKRESYSTTHYNMDGWMDVFKQYSLKALYKWNKPAIKGKIFKIPFLCGPSEVQLAGSGVVTVKGQRVLMFHGCRVQIYMIKCVLEDGSDHSQHVLYGTFQSG